MTKFIFLLTLLVIFGSPIYIIFFKPPPPLPDLDYEAWWGPAERKNSQDTSIRPFRIFFTETMVEDLRNRLITHRPYTPPLDGATFEYGFNTETLEIWLRYWEERYPFTDREKYLNRYPQFKTNIQGLDIHFIKVKPKAADSKEVVPLLLIHGWPGSVREFYEAIPILTASSEDRDFELELIIPSLPGYGFSDAPVRPGLGPVDIAIVMRNLMRRLGYKKYYLQGGDFGSVIGSSMATLFPEEILGFHTNMIYSAAPIVSFFNAVGSVYPPLVVEEKYADRMYPFFTKYLPNLMQETGYLHIQATKPDTVGKALTDSPAGLLAYILEKFSTYTSMDHRSKVDGGLEYCFTKDQLIDNLMLYWVTNSITTSMRLYAETFNKKTLDMKMDEIPTQVPTWVLQARHELSFMPPWMIRFKYPNLLNVTILDDGGHFIALELPKVFSEDVLNAIDVFRRYNKNIRSEL